MTYVNMPPRAATGDDTGQRDRPGKFVPEQRKCQNCGELFTASRAHSVFCPGDTCRKAFDNRKLSQGGPMAPLVKAWIATRHAKPGTREAEICAYARRELTQMASDLNELDERANRSAVDYVETLMRSGTMWVDRARRC